MRAPASAVIPSRYWWCVALFIAASPLSRRAGRRIQIALSQEERTSLTCLGRERAAGGRGQRTRSFTRANTPCVRYVEEYYAVATSATYVADAFLRPRTPAIKIVRRLKNRSSIGDAAAAACRVNGGSILCAADVRRYLWPFQFDTGRTLLTGTLFGIK